MAQNQRKSWGSNSPAARKGYRRLRYWADLHDGRGYRRCSETVAGGVRAGDRRLAELMTIHADDSGSPTLGRVRADWWLPEAQDRLLSGELALNTYKLYETVWRVSIEPRWGDVPVSDIEPMDVQEWLMTLTKWNAVNGKSHAGAVADKAVLLGMLDSNPFKRPYRMPKTGDVRERGVWTLSQIEDACRALRGTAAEVPAILCGLGSCRVGEACAAVAGEVAVSTEANGVRVARIPITRQLLKQGGGVTDRLKNPQSERTVCVAGEWADRIAEIADERERDGLIWLNDDGTGVPVPRQRLQLFWGRLFNSGRPLAGLPRIPLRNLRNSWETFMRWELKVEPDMIDSMMGHAGKGIRIKHYDRPTEDAYAEVCAEAWAKRGL